MAIAPELRAQILRLYQVEQWRVGTIARQLQVHRDTVTSVLEHACVMRPQQPGRPSRVDPYLPFMHETLAKFPTLTARRLHTMVQARGFVGGADYFRHIVARHRPRPPAEAYLRLRTLPGAQMQIDWGHFGHLQIGRARRPLMAFVVVLSYSRRVFVHFSLNARMDAFLQGHALAFAAWGGLARVALYDNLKSAVLERVGDAIRFNPELLAFASHYRYEPRPVAVARGNEKGRVERAIRFVRDAFFAARTYRDLADLNTQADAWCQGAAADRLCPEDRARTMRMVFAEEQPRLLALPAEPFPTAERIEVAIGKTPYARFDLNDYSIPHTQVRRTLTVLATLDTVRVFDGQALLATHPRSFDRGAQIEFPPHLEELVAHKRAGRAHRAQDRLHHAAPSAQALFLRAAARGAHLGVLTRGLLALLASHGASAVEAAVAAALAEDATHLGAVRHFIDAHANARGQRPPIAVVLPDDPRLLAINVRSQPLQAYDQLTPETTDERTEDDPESQC